LPYSSIYLELSIIGLFYPTGEPISAQIHRGTEFAVLHIRLHSMPLVFKPTSDR